MTRAARAERRRARASGSLLRLAWRALPVAVAVVELAPARAALAEPRCVVEATLDRAQAFVGEQLHYHVRVLRRPDATHAWEVPLAFPRARAEWLVGLAAGGALGPIGSPHRIGLSEHRAVFPAHPGPLRIEGASVRCTSLDGDEIVPVPAVEATIEPLPEAGRPELFSGLVGPVRWSASLTPERVTLGGSARLSVVAIGSGNTWLAPSPVAQLAATPDVEVLERRRELARDAGRELVWRRYFAFDVVPRRAGPLALPELRLVHFDPAARAYAEARIALPALDVRESQAASSAGAARPRATADASHARAQRWLPAALGAAALAAAALLAVAALRRRTRRARPAPTRGVDDWLREAHGARARGDADATAAAAARALEGALEGSPPGAWAESARALLARIERGRFAPGAERPALAEVDALLAARPRAAGRPRADC
ncbi:MAG TPA: hypothetical protein VHQ66_13525 [Myxococcota bacterium]|nr:hypothetical protein [Myxococcota bacterium]